MALPHGADPVEELHAGRNGNEEGHEGEERQQDGAGDVHVVSPHGHRQGADGQRREDQADVAEDRLAGEDRNDLGDDAEERQREDVDLRVAEEPEQVLPQDGAAVGGVVDVRAELAVVQNTEGRGGQQREDHEDQHGGGEDGPAEHRHAEHGHARRTHGEQGGDHVDGGSNGAHAGGADANDPHVRADARGVDAVSQRHVHGPAEVSRATRGEEAGQHDETTDGGDPETKVVQTREGHVRRADLQRQHEVGKAPHNRGREQQQHDGAVHGEQLVELLVGQELQTRSEKLRAQQQGHEATEEEEAEGHDDVHDAQLLVVGGGDHLPCLGARFPVPRRLWAGRLDVFLEPWRHSGH